MSRSEEVWCANAPNAILTRLRATVGAARFRDLMVDLPDVLEEIRSPDQRGVAEFHELLDGEHFHAFLTEGTDALDTRSDRAALWAKWIDVMVEQTRPAVQGSKGES